VLILSRRKKKLWQKPGSFSLYFSKLKKKEIQRARIAKEKKTLKTNLVKNATKKNVKILSQMKKRKLKKKENAAIKLSIIPP